MFKSSVMMLRVASSQRRPTTSRTTPQKRPPDFVVISVTVRRCSFVMGVHHVYPIYTYPRTGSVGPASPDEERSEA